MYRHCGQFRASMKKILNSVEGVQAACFLFELNTGRDAVLGMAAKANLPCRTTEEQNLILREWYAFVHAVVLYGLMAKAPNLVVVEYLRSSRALLQRIALYDEDTTTAFLDNAFAAYVEPLLQDERAKCPALFLSRCTSSSSHSRQALVVVSQLMALVLAAILDKMEEYEFSAAPSSFPSQSPSA